MLLAPSLDAQGLLGEFTSRSNERPRLPQSLGFSFSPSTTSRDGEDSVSWRRASVDMSAPLAPLPGGGVGIFPTYDYLSLENDRKTLPPRLVTAGFGLFGIARVEEKYGIRFGGYARYVLKADMDDIGIGDGQYIAAAFAIVPVSPKWLIVPGAGYASDVAVPVLERAPIPSVQAAYIPNDELAIIFGWPFNLISYRPVDRLRLNVSSVGGVLGQVSADESITEHMSLRQYFSSTGEVFTLSNPRFEKDERLLNRGYVVGMLVTVHTAAPFRAQIDPSLTRERTPIQFSLTLGYARHFDMAWIVGETLTTGIRERIGLESGNSFSVDLTYQF